MPAETPLYVESQVQISPAEGRSQVCARHVLIDVGSVVVRHQDLEVVPADGTFEPDRPPKIGVYGARQIVVFRLEFGDDAERRRDHDRRADRYVDGMLKERGGRVATERATCLRHIGWNGEDLH